MERTAFHTQKAKETFLGLDADGQVSRTMLPHCAQDASPVAVLCAVYTNAAHGRMAPDFATPFKLAF